MPWIESHTDLADHPKAKRAARLLGISMPAMVGHLHYLWWWCLKYAQEGDLARFTEEDIADAAQWPHSAGVFVTALLDCGPGDSVGFLEKMPGGRLLVHDWQEYAGKLIEKRRNDAERKKVQRTSNGHPTDVQWTSNGRRVDGAWTAQVPTNQPTIPTIPTNQPTKKSRGPIAYTDDFEEFWAFYPRSTGKQEGMRKWVATLSRTEAPDHPKATPEMLINAAKNYAVERDGEEEKYTKHAATFLGPDEHWREYLEPKKKTSRNERPTRVYDDLQGKLEEMRRIREENCAKQNPSP